MSTIPYPFYAAPQLILEMAMGVERPETIIERHGLDWPTWQALKDDPAFVSQVEAKRAELKREGHTFRAKCALAAEDLIGDVYVRAKAADVGLGGKLEAAKFFAKMGNLEPREDKAAMLGAAFQISIDMGDGKTITIGAGVPTGVRNETEVEGTTLDVDSDLDALPGYLASLAQPRNDFAYAE